MRNMIRTEAESKQLTKNRIVRPVSDVRSCLFSFLSYLVIIFFISHLSPLTLSAATKKFTLVIDAGHGGMDSGALGSYSKEKNVALKVALNFGRYVERNCPDVKVIYTRKTDVFVSLEGRANIANRNKADLFVSIHCNSLPGRKIARGMETYTLGMHRAQDNLDVAKRENEVILYEKDYKQRYAGFDPRSSESYIMFELMQDNNMQQSVEMAKLVQQKTCASAGRQNKGVKQAGFLVLRETSMPSCLIELGFISTPDEERALNDPAKQDAFGRGIYQAFIAYKKKVTGAGVPYKEEPKSELAELPTIVPPSETTGKTKPAEKEKTEKAKPAEKPAEKENTAEEPAEEPAEKAKPAEQEKPDSTKAAPSQAPIFKVQILTSNTRLKAGDSQFKGQKDVDFYQENKLFKYTVGASANYNEIYQLRKTLLPKFPEAFIIAFRNGEKMDVVEAIKEYKRLRK